MKSMEEDILSQPDTDICIEVELPDVDETPSTKGLRKSARAKKTPMHLVDTDEPFLKLKTNKAKTPRQTQHHYSDFKCDHCGSRYVVNPMRRGNKISTSKYKAAPRHKIDPVTQKILTLCNACGLKFGRSKKNRVNKEELSIEDQKRVSEEGEKFGEKLAEKLENEAASQLFCSHAKKIPCGCIQKYIVGENTENPDTIEEIIDRAQFLLEVLLKATELKKMKCYDLTTLDTKPGKRNAPKIGLGNGHRKSKEFEDFVLDKRTLLRNDLKLCEKASQKLLSYSNNFLHKRLKTDPEKGIRVDRQKGKAALGMLKEIPDLPLDPCCADNCVRMALTHGRLLECWRRRANSSQVEARRVLAEMLTPSGGNRANCYKFISWVTGCSNTTIGKVNEQMKNTGGDREPPEHGLKKYWRFNPKIKKSSPETMEPTFVPSYQILQTAASSAGLVSMMQNTHSDINRPLEPPQKKKTKKKAVKTSVIKGERVDFTASRPPNRLANTFKIVENAEVALATASNDLSAYPSAVIAVNGQFPNDGFISIPAGLTSESMNAVNTISIQALQQQIQQQQQQHQLQLQIQLLQQQLHNSQNTLAAQAAAQTIQCQSSEGSTTEYIVTPSAIEQTVGTPVVVQTVTSLPQASVMPNVVTQSLIPNVVNTETVLPTIVAQANSSMADFLTQTTNMNILQALGNQTRVTPNILMTSPMRNSNEISIIAQNNPVSINVLNSSATTDATAISERVTQQQVVPVAQQVHLIASQQPAPTMPLAAISQPLTISQPITISLQQPSLTTLPTMLLTSTTQEHLVQQPQQQQLIIQHAHAQQQQRTLEQHQQVVIQTTHSATQARSSQPTQLITHHAAALHNQPPTCQQSVVVNSSMLPPITSFNADAFLTNGDVSSSVGTVYTVVNNNSLADMQ